MPPLGDWVQTDDPLCASTADGAGVVAFLSVPVFFNMPCFGSRGSEVRVLSPRPFKIMGYGLDRSPFFVWASTGASVWYGDV